MSTCLTTVTRNAYSSNIALSGTASKSIVPLFRRWQGGHFSNGGVEIL